MAHKLDVGDGGRTKSLRGIRHIINTDGLDDTNLTDLEAMLTDKLPPRDPTDENASAKARLAELAAEINMDARIDDNA